MSARDFDVDTCVQKEDEGIERNEFLQREFDFVMAEAQKDCEDAILGSDENDVTRALTTIGNKARELSESGDTDLKLAFVDDVCTIIKNLSEKYAKQEAEFQWEKKNGRIIGRRNLDHLFGDVSNSFPRLVK